MKMVMAVVPHEEADRVLDALIDAGHAVTFTESRGGMLRQSQQMLFTAVEESNLEEVLSIIRLNCRMEVPACTEESEGELTPEGTPVIAQLGGAIVFTWALDDFEVC
jgi:uncharacterized protein YaaQ